jgi:hypothetical protein
VSKMPILDILTEFQCPKKLNKNRNSNTTPTKVP